MLDALAAHVPGDPEKERHLCEELGDLWLQVAFHAQLARERGAWDLHDVEAMVVEKLVRRHPHVFGEVAVDGCRGGPGELGRHQAGREGRPRRRGPQAPPGGHPREPLAPGRGHGDRQALRQGRLRVARPGGRAGQGARRRSRSSRPSPTWTAWRPSSATCSSAWRSGPARRAWTPTGPCAGRWRASAAASAPWRTSPRPRRLGGPGPGRPGGRLAARPRRREGAP